MKVLASLIFIYHGTLKLSNLFGILRGFVQFLHQAAMSPTEQACNLIVVPHQGSLAQGVRIASFALIKKVLQDQADCLLSLNGKAASSFT